MGIIFFPKEYTNLLRATIKGNKKVLFQASFLALLPYFPTCRLSNNTIEWKA